MLENYLRSVNSAAPTLIASAPISAKGKIKIYVANNGANDVYLGSSDVLSTDGYLLVKAVGQTIGYRQEFEIFSGESLYAICASGLTSTVAVIVTGL